MKRKTFYQLSLSVPYLMLILTGGLIFLLDRFLFISSPAYVPSSAFVGVLYFFVISAIVWAPLYTWMVVVFLLWSRKRSASEVRQLYVLSPVVLACSMGVPALAVDARASAMLLLIGFLGMNQMGYLISKLPMDSYSGEASLGIAGAWFFMALTCLVVGYAIVGLMVWLERSLEKRSLFRDEVALAAP